MRLNTNQIKMRVVATLIMIGRQSEAGHTIYIACR